MKSLSVKILLSIVLCFVTACGFIFGNKDTREEVKNSLEHLSGPIVLMGDSLAYGAGASSSQKALLGCFKNLYPEKKVINKARNGATTADALRVLNSIRSLKSSLVFISLGGNDVLAGGLRGSFPAEQSSANLQKIFDALTSEGSLVVYLGLNPPGNFFMGRKMDVKRLRKLQDIAKDSGVLLIENAMSGLWKNSSYMSDQIHPNDLGYSMICDKIKEQVRLHYYPN